jgi:hypothetical protein
VIHEGLAPQEHHQRRSARPAVDEHEGRHGDGVSDRRSRGEQHAVAPGEPSGTPAGGASRRRLEVSRGGDSAALVAADAA